MRVYIEVIEVAKCPFRPAFQAGFGIPVGCISVPKLRIGLSDWPIFCSALKQPPCKCTARFLRTISEPDRNTGQAPLLFSVAIALNPQQKPLRAEFRALCRSDDGGLSSDLCGLTCHLLAVSALRPHSEHAV